MISAYQARIQSECNLYYSSIMNEIEDAVESAVERGALDCVVTIVDESHFKRASSKVIDSLGALGYKVKLDSELSNENKIIHKFNISWNQS